MNVFEIVLIAVIVICVIGLIYGIRLQIRYLGFVSKSLKDRGITGKRFDEIRNFQRNYANARMGLNSLSFGLLSGLIFIPIAVYLPVFREFATAGKGAFFPGMVFGLVFGIQKTIKRKDALMRLAIMRYRKVEE
ncbi:MAG: hypothetical protein AAF429_15340 [Pseudomonadota bacterium]